MEAVATRPDRRGAGHATRVMEALAGVIRGGYDIGALGATDMAAPLYRKLGWLQWQGPLYALTPDGIVRTPVDEKVVHVLPVAEPLDVTAALTCDWRDGGRLVAVGVRRRRRARSGTAIFQEAQADDARAPPPGWVRPIRTADGLYVRRFPRLRKRTYGGAPFRTGGGGLRRAGIGTLAAALAIALAFAASALGSPTPSRSLERAATASSSPAALRAEARLRRIETRVLGRAHATEHARMRAGIRRERAIARRRARLGLPPKRRPAPRRAMALGDPSQVGRWSAPRGVPVVAVHAILLPTGRLMLVQQDADGGVAYILDPDTGAGHRVDPPGNIWCGGQTFLADGPRLAIGGTLEHIGGDNYSGLNHLYVFDPVTETWTRQADMRHGRWYPTGMRMPDGRVLITSGWDESGTMTMNADVEVYTPTGPTGRVDLVGSRVDELLPPLVRAARRARTAGGTGPLGLGVPEPLHVRLHEQPDPQRLAERLRQRRPAAGPAVGVVASVPRRRRRHDDHRDVRRGQPVGGLAARRVVPQIRRNLNTVILPDGDLLGSAATARARRGRRSARR